MRKARSLAIAPALALLLLLPGPRGAQARPGPGGEGDKFAGEPFSRGVGGRGLAMGSAFVALAEGPAAIYWNPAGLAGGQKREILAMHSESFGGAIDHDFLGFAQPSPRGGRSAGFGVGVLRLGVSGFDSTALPDPTRPPGPDNLPFVTRTFGVSNYEIFFSYGQAWGEWLRVGGSVKVLHERLFVATGTGFGFDLGVIAQPSFLEPLALGVAAQDVPTSFLAFSTGKRETISPTLRVGLSLPGGVSLGGGRLVVAMDTALRFERRGAMTDQFALGALSGNLHLGGEYWLGDHVAFRGGLDEGAVTAGAGVVLDRLSADYAWLASPGEALGPSNRVSLGVRF